MNLQESEANSVNISTTSSPGRGDAIGHITTRNEWTGSSYAIQWKSEILRMNEGQVCNICLKSLQAGMTAQGRVAAVM